MSKMIDFPRPDGQSCPGYLASPAGGGADRPGIVVIQEWWGLNDQIKKTADRFAAAGFRALVPDLYRGNLATDADEAQHMMTSLDWGQASQQDLRGALTYLKAGGQKAAVLGFCMGGAMTIIAAANLEQTDAGVCFYGIPPAKAADPKAIKVPLMCHFATVDDWCTPEAVAKFEAELKAGSVNFELFRYEGRHHAFFNEARPEVYDAEAATLAFDRSLEFLNRNLA